MYGIKQMYVNYRGEIKDDISKNYQEDYKKSIINIKNTDTVACKFDSLISQACQRVFKLKHFDDYFFVKILKVKP